jgi:hypothetical protein
MVRSISEDHKAFTYKGPTGTIHTAEQEIRRHYDPSEHNEPYIKGHSIKMHKT